MTSRVEMQTLKNLVLHLLLALCFATSAAQLCTQDVKECPDGSFVGRDPDNNCEFFPCPSTNFCPEDVKRCLDGTVVERDPDNNCEFFPCPSLIACPADVRECPDGSFVSRDPKKLCQFENCPDCSNGWLCVFGGSCCDSDDEENGGLEAFIDSVFALCGL